MIRYCLPAMLLFSACQSETTCEPCTQQRLDGMTLAERTKAAIASGEEDAVPRAPKRYEQILEGRDFCETLPELSAEAVREHLLKNDISAVTEIGMMSLALCQFYYRDDDAATLSLYRLLTYIDLKEEREGVTDQSDYFRYVSGQLMSENGPVSIDFYAGSTAQSKSREGQRFKDTDFFDSAASEDVDSFWQDGGRAYFRESK